MSTMAGLLAGGAALVGATLLAKRASGGGVEGCGCGLAQSADMEEQEMFFGGPPYAALVEARKTVRAAAKKRKKSKKKKKKSAGYSGAMRALTQKGQKATRKKAKRKTSRKKKTTRRKKARRRSMSGLGESCSIMGTPSGPRCYCNKKFAKMSACGR